MKKKKQIENKTNKTDKKGKFFSTKERKKSFYEKKKDTPTPPQPKKLRK